MPVRISLFILLVLSTFGAAGCASVARDMLEEHQCQREASNRPDALQRKAECEQRMRTEDWSQAPDS